MSRIKVVAGALALTAGLSGCWLQPGYNAGHTGWSSGETTITSANVDQLVSRWDTAVPGTGGVGAVVSNAGKVFTTRGLTVSALQADSGTEVWHRELPPELDGVVRTLHGPVVFDGKLLVGAEDWALSFPGGQVYDLRLVDGTTSGSSANTSTLDLAVAGALVRQTINKVSSLGDFVTWLDWTYRPALPVRSGNGAPPARYAIVGDRVAWSFGTSAVGYDSTCPPASSGQLCPPKWQTDLGAAPRDIAALGNTQIAYTDASGTLSVLDAGTGIVDWTADVAADRIAVADQTILVGTTDGHLAAFSNSGCGEPTCAPAWTAPLAGPAGDPVAGGDVVYVPAGGDIAAFAVHGCDAATCPALATLDAPRELVSAIVDDGRVVATSTDGHLVAFGLPG